MNWRIDKSTLPSYLRLVITGKPSVDDYLRLWQLVLALDEWNFGTQILKDVTDRAKRFDHAADFVGVVYQLMKRFLGLLVPVPRVFERVYLRIGFGAGLVLEKHVVTPV